jgi:hypothetical protein
MNQNQRSSSLNLIINAEKLKIFEAFKIIKMIDQESPVFQKL